MMTIKTVAAWFRIKESRIFIGLIVFISLWTLAISIISVRNGSMIAQMGYGFHGANHYWMFYKQLYYVILGLLVFGILQRFDITVLARYRWVYVVGASVLCGLPPILGIGNNFCGASRWLQIMDFHIHTGFWACILFVLFVSSFFAKDDSTPSWKMTSIIFVFYLLINIFLMAQPDIPRMILLFAVSIIALIIFHYWKTAAAFATASIILLSLRFTIQPYAILKIKEYLFSLDGNFQVVQSLKAVHHGGFFGSALCGKPDALIFVPSANTDFIFSSVANQFGLVGVIFMLVVCVGFFYFGVRAAIKALNRFEAILTFLLAAMWVTMTVFNIWVSLGMLPTMGISMPFFSYGGANVLFGFLTAGMIYRQLKRGGEELNLLKLHIERKVAIVSFFCAIVLVKVIVILFT